MFKQIAPPLHASVVTGEGLREAELTPIAFSKAKAKWRPIEMRTNSLTLKGGFSGRTFVVDTLDVHDPLKAEPDTFVAIKKNEEWFLKLCGGDHMLKGNAKAVRLTEILERKMRIAVDAAHAGRITNDAAVAEADDVDPMDALDGVAEAESVAPIVSARTLARRRKHCVYTIDVPFRPPCADPGGNRTVKVQLYHGGRTLKKAIYSLGFPSLGDHVRCGRVVFPRCGGKRRRRQEIHELCRSRGPER